MSSNTKTIVEIFHRGLSEDGVILVLKDEDYGRTWWVAEDTHRGSVLDGPAVWEWGTWSVQFIVWEFAEGETSWCALERIDGVVQRQS